ncbi:hypothetical protein QAD02_015864 [Eretmocerus hayati]|uniref:Uncharacterized protein n=1 Tax=Eretmocerus hayati TaxID=131215 RepID=A0ACC2P9U9_9HYME|nr:hypothetical protein QAD02_015864 [Eretmocerus hayati]
MLKCLSTCIIFSLLASSSASQNPGGFLWDALSNIVSLGAGGIKFINELFRYESQELSDFTPTNGAEFDFIVIGAGSAGAAIAARLSEVQDVNILLIEAGYHENLIMDIPIIALYLQYFKKLHWNHLTAQSNSSCLGMENRQCKLPFGKVMGGTSVMNAMMATRGTRKNYDEWAAMTGDNSWSYEGMLKYFKKLERHDVTKAPSDSEYHNFDGPVRIADVPYRTSYVHSWIKAGKELGLPAVDYNGKKLIGLNYLQTNIAGGERASSNRAYLHGLNRRKNLKVTMLSHVNKILINPETKNAYGVEFTKLGETINVIAKKEVIVSAGPLGSPQLLMLSGIGPRKHLQSLGIPVLVDAPVGENLMDHLSFIGLNFLTNDTGGIYIPDFIKPDNPSISDWFNFRKGPLTTPTGVEGIGYVNVYHPRNRDVEPNLEFIFGGTAPPYYIYKALGFTDEHNHRSFGGVNAKRGYFIWPVIIQPKSRGKILLKDANPTSHPVVISNYLSHPEDVKIGVKGIKLALGISNTDALQHHGARLNQDPTIGCEHLEFLSDDYWECTLRTLSISLWHHCGTCKMGHQSDETAVVNTKLQVRGIRRLRVADASIIPKIPTAHLNLPTMAIGEKAADIIKCEWGYLLDSSCKITNVNENFDLRRTNLNKLNK